MTDISGGEFIAHGPLTIASVKPPPQYLTIGPHVRISLDDGALEYGNDYAPDEAARMFWEAMSSTYRDALAANKRIRAFLEDMAGWCSPHGVAADYAQRGLDALDGVDPLGPAGPTRQEQQDRNDTLDAAIAHTALAAIRDYLETSDDTGIRTREHLLGILDQAGVPSTFAEETEEEFDAAMAAGEPVELVNLPELTREDAVEAMQEMASDLYTAQDRLAFVREMCDQADREQRQVTTEQVRAWTNYTGCGGAIVLHEDEQVALQERLEADRDADMVNAPLRPETIATIAERIKSGDYPVRKVKRRETP